MSLKRDVISVRGHKLYNLRGKSMKWAKRQTARLHRRLWQRMGEDAPMVVTRGYAD